MRRVVRTGKPRRRPRQLEHAAQVVVVERLRSAKILHCAIPNGGYALSPQAAKRMVAAGLSAGAPDVLIFDPPPLEPHFIGTALEMKSEVGKKPTPEQEAWHVALAARGWRIVVAYGFAEALSELARLGYRVPR